jgi:hypothetical protein
MTSRLLLGAAVLAAVAIACLVPATASAKSCDVGNTRGYGTTYVLEIAAKGVTCSKAKALIRAYHDCRPGKKGKCARVDGYSCSERRFNQSPQSYDSEATCKKGAKRVTHTYTQFT